MATRPYEDKDGNWLIYQHEKLFNIIYGTLTDKRTIIIDGAPEALLPDFEEVVRELTIREEE